MKMRSQRAATDSDGNSDGHRRRKPEGVVRGGAHTLVGGHSDFGSI